VKLLLAKRQSSLRLSISIVIAYNYLTQVALCEIVSSDVTHIGTLLILHAAVALFRVVSKSVTQVTL